MKYAPEVTSDGVILWRINPLLSSDSVNNGRYEVAPATYTHETIEKQYFLCGPLRGVLLKTIDFTLTSVE
jgi:hypothetical protein